jgi:hypothetical protein
MRLTFYLRKCSGAVRWLLLLFPVVLLLQTSCTSQISDAILSDFGKTFGDIVIVKNSDATPPAVTLTFDHPMTKNRIVLKSGDPPLTVPITANDYFYVVAAVEDADGAKDIRIKGFSRTACKLLDDVITMGDSNIFHDYPDSAKPGDKAMTRRWLPYLVSGVNASIYQTQGQKFLSYSVNIYAEGENFSGLVIKTPEVTFVQK